MQRQEFLTRPLIFYRSYSRIIDGLRESWADVCDRTLSGLKAIGNLTDEQAALIDRLQREYKSITSGRFLWVGGTEWLNNPDNVYGSYNCSSTIIDSIHAIALQMSLSMTGCGVGAMIENKFISKIPKVTAKIDVTVTPMSVNWIRGGRLEETQTKAVGDDFLIVVGDSRQGWVDAYEQFMTLAVSGFTGTIKIEVDLTYVRPKGETINGFGGVANASKLPQLWERLADILNGAIGRNLNAEEVCLLIDEGLSVVVAGNIRRSAGIKQLDASGKLLKTDLWSQDKDGNWVIDPKKDALRMSNHTRVYHKKPTRDECIEAVRSQYFSGEGAIQWAGEAIARANADLLDEMMPRSKKTFLELYNQDVSLAKEYLGSDMIFDPEMTGRNQEDCDRELDHRMLRYGLNPCGEIAFTNGFCNLYEVHLNMLDPNDLDEQDEAFYAAGLGVSVLLHQSFPEERYQYSRTVDPIVGVSFTGLFDFFVNRFGVDWLRWWEAGRPKEWGNVSKSPYGSEEMDFPFLSDYFLFKEQEYLQFWKESAFRGVYDYCDRNGLRRPNRCTTVQPSGCLTAESLRVSNDGLFYVDELIDAGVGNAEFPTIEIRDGLTSNSGIGNAERTDLIKITLSHGRQITGTPCHRFSIDGRWVRIDEITEGMVLDFKTGSYTNLVESVLETWHTPDTIGRGRQPKRCEMPEYMSPDLAYFVGAVYGNGCFCSSYRIRISHGRTDVLLRLRDIGLRLFGLRGILCEDFRGGRKELCFTNKQLVEWFKLNKLDKNAKSIELDRFPVLIRTASRNSILGFFAGLIDTDGCIRSNGALSIDMACESFIRNAQQVGEAVGLVFGVSHNTQGENLQHTKNIWSLSLSKCSSDPVSIEKLNHLSLKAIDNPILCSSKTNGKKPFVVTSIERNQVGYTYDITINTDDDDEAWYWQGALKSHNSKSLLTNASPGWHPPKASRYIRRMTFARDHSIASAAIAYGYSVIPSQSDKDENGRLLDNPFDPRCTEWLVEVPIETSWVNLEGAADIDISKFSALAQFDFYMQVQKNYTTHNTSATLEVRESEIELLGDRIYQAIRDDEGYISSAILARFDDLQTFPRLPFEPIDKETYDRLVKEVEERRTIDSFASALQIMDSAQSDDQKKQEISEAGPAGCDSDKCLFPNAVVSG